MIVDVPAAAGMVAFANDELLDSIKSIAQTPDKFHSDMEQRLVSMSLQQVALDGVTNLGLFRKHIVTYLKAKQDINQQMYLVVRQLSPTGDGLPIKIYCFSKSTD